MSNKHRDYKSSSHSRRTDDDRNRSQIASRTVIYEEPSSTSNKTLKSSVRQVNPPSSFYNTSTTTKPSQPKPLTVGSGKQSRAINSDLYHSEIVEDDEDDEEGEIQYLSDEYHKRSRRRSTSEDRSKRRHHSSSQSSISDDNSDEDGSIKNKRHKNRRRNSSKEQRSPSEEGEEAESVSDASDDHHSKEEHQSVTTTEDQKEQRTNSSADDHFPDDDERQEGEEETVPAQPHRSRFDDHDDDIIEDDQEEENGSSRHHRHHHRRHHKRSRRHSSSTPASSSSKSAMTPPILNSYPIEKELIEEKPKLPCYYPAIQGCRRVDEYLCLNRIEEGTYGVVFRAKDRKSGEIVALKRLKMEKEKEGFPITSLREICCILKSQHENVCTVREIVVGDDMNRIYIVMDYVEHDLKSLMTHTMKKPFSIGEIKTLMYQLLSGVNHLHDNWIIHRDLKTSNLLLSNKGILKIGDFGLAREYGSPLKAYTPIVVTLWYRSPELLLGIKEYSTLIDIWSVGAIFGELLLMKPLFPGKSELDQLNRIFKDLGTPTDKIWPEYSSLPFTKKMTFSHYPYNRLRTRFGGDSLSEKGFDLLNKFLTYDPSKRISAINALKHGYFEEIPRRIDPSMFPTWPSRNEEKDKTTRGIAGGIEHISGSNTATAQDEPKPPSGGKMYKKLLGGGDDDDESYSMDQLLPPALGFQLRG
ncbi:unnamed protein product [Adineta steineri]|uniref:cyclin-dependent kinase n=1 Tax=Adineta steineri TaxID=433720 RepID=A0A814C8Q4_9BILA|nr:unnamed protein product [Adineta steineri]CAF3516929.1 unnamed protein product [Adineta steineri]